MALLTARVRGAAAALVAVAACSPEIPDGSYFCGPQELCPTGDACNGPDNTCVNAGFVMPFACDPLVEHEPDDTQATAHALPAFTCVSPGVSNPGCLSAGDPANWVSFVAPSGCTSITVIVDVQFPTAFEPVDMSLHGSDGGVVAMGSACTSATPGDTAQCLSASLADGSAYAVEFAADAMNCGGACGFNSYTYALAIGH
jgi:hypothetical protein